MQYEAVLLSKRGNKNAQHLCDVCRDTIQLHILRDHLRIALQRAKLPDVPETQIQVATEPTRREIVALIKGLAAGPEQG